MAAFKLRNKFPNEKLYGFVKITLENKTLSKSKTVIKVIFLLINAIFRSFSFLKFKKITETE